MTVPKLPDAIARVLAYRDFEPESKWNRKAVRLLGLALEDETWPLLKELRQITAGAGTLFTQLKKLLTSTKKYPRQKLVDEFRKMGLPAMSADDKKVPLPDIHAARLIVHFINGYFGQDMDEGEENLRELDEIRAKLMSGAELTSDEQIKLSTSNNRHVNFDLSWENDSGEVINMACGPGEHVTLLQHQSPRLDFLQGEVQKPMMEHLEVRSPKLSGTKNEGILSLIYVYLFGVGFLLQRCPYSLNSRWLHPFEVPEMLGDIIVYQTN